jgi:hypothetical protein
MAQKMYRHNDAYFTFVGETEKEGQSVAQVCPAGGGFVYNVPVDKFQTEFEEASEDFMKSLKEFVPVAFSIESFGGVLEFEGYDNGQRWNGWAIPAFTYDQLRQVATFIEEEMGEKDRPDFPTISFHSDGLVTYTVPERVQEDYEEDKITVPLAPHTGRCDDQLLTLYHLYDSWTWSVEE